MPGRRFAPSGDPALKSPARRALRDQVRKDAMATGRGCELPICVMPIRQIDWSAKTGPWSYVLDEIVPRVAGGSSIDPGNVRPGHQRCNAVAGVRLTNQIKLRARLAEGRPHGEGAATAWLAEQAALVQPSRTASRW